MFDFDSKTGFRKMPTFMPRPTLSCLLAVLMLLAAGQNHAAESATTSTAATAPSSLIQATDLLNLKQLESPALSPDGKWVVYAVRSIEPKSETADDWSYQTHLWLAATDGSTAPRQLTRDAGSDSSPAWSPTGDRIAFVRTAEKQKPQIYLLPIAGGEAKAITKIATGGGNPRWSSDGHNILFTSELSYSSVRAALEKAGVDSKPQWPVERPGRTANDTANSIVKAENKDNSQNTASVAAGPEEKAASATAPSPDGSLPQRREWLAKNEAESDPRVLDRLNFQSETDLEPELNFTHVWVQETEGDAEARDLTPGYASYATPEWMPDGKSIVCAGPQHLDVNPDRDEFSSLYVIDAVAGGAKLLAELKDYRLAEPHPSPDGKTIAFTAQPGDMAGYGQTSVATVPAGGGEIKLLSEKLDRNAGNLKWAPAGKSIYFIVPSHGGFPLYNISADGGAAERISPSETTGVRAYDLGADRLVQVLTTPTNPAELYAGPATSTNADNQPLTTHNRAWLTGKELSSYEPHSFVNQDGLTIEYWTMKPARFDPTKKYPLLLEIHGGPHAMWGPGEDSMWFEFQYFAARGYAVVFANPRGSGGYGNYFERANHKDWGVGPASDILGAADFAAKERYVARYRQVVTGGSYGGYMTVWLIGHDHRFKAAVAQRGLYDLGTFFGEGNAWGLVRSRFDGYPWESETRQVLEHESPLTYVDNITTPLLIQHGDNDRRTGFVQSEMLFRSLKVLGRPVEEVRYPRASHELSRTGEPKQRLDSLVRYDEFFRRFIGEN
jgi:dipeptidyl aminopeptidase/acylaminoacyl peptidase